MARSGVKNHGGVDPAKILVVLPTWVGDFAMATPTLRVIRERFPDARITFLSEPNLIDMARGAPWMDECVAYPPKGKRQPWHREQRQLILDLRRRKFDWAILLPNSFRSALTARLGGAKRRIGYDRDGRGLMLTDRLSVTNWKDGEFVPVPLVDYYADLAEFVGCARPNDRLELFTTPDCDAAIAQRLASLGLDEARPLVVVSPGAKFGASKCWMPERFAGVADRLIERLGASIVVTCGPGEEHLAREIASNAQGKVHVFDDPRTTLGQLKSLIARCDLLLCNDTGPRHFAKAFDVPVVTVFGPTHREWTDTDYPAERIVRIDVDCGPCQKKVCPLGHLKCMTGVTVEMVEQACVELLDKHVSGNSGVGVESGRADRSEKA